MSPRFKGNIGPSNHEKKVAEWVSRDLFRDPAGRALIRSRAHGGGGEHVERLINQRISRAEYEQLYHGVNPFRAPILPKGQIPFGVDTQGKVIELDPNLLRAHMVTFGGPGAGKSAWIFFYLPALCSWGARILAVDLYKRHLRRLFAIFATMGLTLAILDWRQLRYNPLQSPIKDTRLYLSVIGELLCKTMDLRALSKVTLRRCLSELYEHYGIDGDTPTTKYPTLCDVLQWFGEKGKALNYSVRAVVTEKLEGLVRGFGEEIISFHRAWTARDFREQNVVLELAGAPENVKGLMLNSINFGVFQALIEQGIPNQDLRYLCVLDDPQLLLQDYGAEAVPFAELVAVCRGYGVGLCLNLQSHYGVSDLLLGNIGTRFLGRVGRGETYASVGRDLGLSAEQLDWAKKNLKPGLFVGQLGEGEYREPFLIQTPNIPLPREVSDAEIEQSLRPLLDLPVIHADSPVSPSRSGINASAKPTVSDSNRSDLAMKFLGLVVAQPLRTVGFYTKALKLNGKQASALRQPLVSRGLILERSVSKSLRGRPSILLEATPQGVTAHAKWKGGRP